MKLLIVDDEPGIRESLGDFFRDEGFTVITASDGQEALELLAGPELPDAIILDLLMPVLGGAELYALMQGEPRLSSIPVIITTSDPGRAPAGLLIMKKPVNLDRLLGAVQQCRR
jgi:CheY-like chemotaxis protein